MMERVLQVVVCGVFSLLVIMVGAVLLLAAVLLARRRTSGVTLLDLQNVFIMCIGFTSPIKVPYTDQTT